MLSTWTRLKFCHLVKSSVTFSDPALIKKFQTHLCKIKRLNPLPDDKMLLSNLQNLEEKDKDCS